MLAALELIKTRGAIGESSLSAAVAHADQFVAALPAACARLADLGSGGGLPGLVISVRRPDIAITLVERRRTRADLLNRAVRSLQLADRVTVEATDVSVLAAEVPMSFDVVTARSFAVPVVTMRWASALLRPGGILIVSEPPAAFPETTLRWPVAALRSAGLTDLGPMAGVRRLQRITEDLGRCPE